MRDSQRSLLVGFTFLAAVAGVTYAITTLRGTMAAANSTDFQVDFLDAKGLLVGSSVRMAGIHIGSVTSVQLVDGKARLSLRVENRYPLNKQTDFELITPLIGAAPYVQVRLGKNGAPIAEGDVLPGRDTKGVDGLVGTADSVLSKVDSIMGDKQMQDDIRKTVHNLRIASDTLPLTLKEAERIMKSAAELSENTAALVPKIERQLNVLTKQTSALLTDIRAATQSGKLVADEATGLTKDLRDTVLENRTTIKELILTTNATMDKIALLVTDIKGTLTDPALKDGIKKSVTNFEEITANVIKMTKTLDDTATGLEKLVNDPALAADIKGTITNVKEMSSSVKDLAKRAEAIRLPGERRNNSIKGGNSIPKIAEPGLTFDARYGTKSGRLRQDVHVVTQGLAPATFFRFGLFDATEGNRVDIQQGIIRREDTIFRYGLFAGKLGVGLDQSLRGYDFRLDLWNPSILTVDARLRKRLDAGTAVFAGYDNVGRSGGPVFGIQWKR